MPATLPRSVTSGMALAAGGAAVAAALAVAVAVMAQRGNAPPAAEPSSPVSGHQRMRQDHCVEGAVLFHDVRWAVACTALGEQGLGDGHPECELPDAQAQRLYALLQQAEQKCAADARAAR